ncbi:MAG: ABC transporter substrate-binding protein, partial [Candidatus Binatia bacterium]
MVAFGAACGVCASGCQATSPPPHGLVIALESDPQSLDPRFGVDAATSRLADLMHVALTRTDAHLRRVPELARSWSSPDPRTVVFRLRDDFRFTTGEPVRAGDVRATYEGVLDPVIASPRRGGLQGIAAIETPDDLTVVIRLRAPDGAFLDATGLPILPAPHARDASEVTVGAGPYQLVEAHRGDRIVLSPNPHFPGGPPRIDPVVLRIVPDAVVRVLELERGSVGFVQDALEPELLDRLRARQTLRVTETPGSSFAYLAINLRDRRLRDRRVRRAIAMAIDQG